MKVSNALTHFLAIGLCLLITAGSSLAVCPSAGSTDRCGPQANATYGGSCKCIPGLCCSQYGYCGPSAALNANDPQAAYCGQGCQSAYGVCGTSPPGPRPPPPPPPRPPPPPPPRPPPPPPPVATKTITISVDSVNIANTRSRHEDTDFVSCYVKVNAQVVSSVNTPVGDRNNGRFSPGTKCTATAKVTDKVEVGFQIVNSGNSNTAQTAISKGIDVLSGVLVADGQVWASFIPAAAGPILNLLFADCDGTVAADKAPSNGAQAAGTLQSATYTNKYYPGYNSPSGCGSNSQYYVDWHYTVT